ncbi:hypothetical protein OH76DRAFT_1365490, partial [Lentinus brumalis]
MHNCPHHQSIYTCLSRGATLDGTIIVQPFDIDKLSGGIAGSLRQEFRELELLDEITRLRHLETISPKVAGITRNELIHSFRQWKGEQFTPPSTHNALKWSARDPFPIEQPVADSPWVILKTGPNAKGAQSDHQQKVQKRSIKQNTLSLVPAKGSQVLHNVVTDESKALESKIEPERKFKKIKASQPPAGHRRRGFEWDSINHSCAYDSLLVILFALYEDCQEGWHATVPNQS